MAKTTIVDKIKTVLEQVSSTEALDTNFQPNNNNELVVVQEVDNNIIEYLRNQEVRFVELMCVQYNFGGDNTIMLQYIQIKENNSHIERMKDKDITQRKLEIAHEQAMEDKKIALREKDIILEELAYKREKLKANKK